MEQELREILEQLRSLTARIENMLAASEADRAEVSALNEAEEEEILEASSTEEPAPEEPPTEACPPSNPGFNFTLNDRFRFQRSIFGNSPERMANALSAIGAMTSADEVYTYLTNVLSRDPENKDVEDFFREVTLRFSDHKPLVI